MKHWVKDKDGKFYQKDASGVDLATLKAQLANAKKELQRVTQGKSANDEQRAKHAAADQSVVDKAQAVVDNLQSLVDAG